MKKARVYFHGKTDTDEQVISKTVVKLKIAKGVELLVENAELLNGTQEEQNEKITAAYRQMEEYKDGLEVLRERAREAAVFEVTLNILSEQATLIDLDKAYKKGGNGKWTIA